MVRTEEFFAPKKNKKDRLKEIAEGVKKGVDEKRDEEKAESENEGSPVAEEGGIPGFNFDKFVEQMANEIDLDIGQGKSDLRKKEGLLPESVDIKKLDGKLGGPVPMTEEEKVDSD